MGSGAFDFEERPFRAPVPRLTPAGRVGLLSGVLGGVAVALYVAVVGHLGAPTAGSFLPWWPLAACFAATDLFVLNLESRRGPHSLSLSELPLVLCLFFLGGPGLLAARLGGAALALALHRRRSLTRFAFTLSASALEAGLASAVFHAVLGTAGRDQPQAWAAAFVAVMVAALVSSIAMCAARALYEGRVHGRRVARRVATAVALSTVANTSLGLVAAVVILTDVRAVWLLLVVASLLCFSYGGYSGLRQRYGRLEQLYEFTRIAVRSLQVEEMVEELLTRARQMMGAHRAEIALPGAIGEDTVTMRIGPEGHLETSQMTALPPHGMHGRVLRTGRSLLVSRNPKDPLLKAQLDSQGFKDALVVPLRGEGGVIGTMLVADHVSDTGTFDADDLELFQTLAEHASLSLENGRLVERLREEAAQKEHQALHDGLTGLPNRTLFHERIRRAISSAKANNSLAAVMLVDLDRFKEVNDTLGHHNGDLLLQAVSGRLKGTLKRTDTIARLGGDEFAVLLAEIPDASEAAHAAQRILRALDEPIVLRELTLDVGASIGIAVYPTHGEDPTTLLQRADVAMYRAKADHSGYEVYAPESDQYSPRRLALVGDLRVAIDNRELAVHFQPQADLLSGRVTGVEALLRWDHPRHGLVRPNEFIPIAEHTGVIRPLTLHVVSMALEQCATWRASGWKLNVAVNLSVRNVFDSDLPDQVARLLRETGVAAGALTLEITEGSVMGEPGPTLDVLARLSSMGVTVSIDNFGTGASSLSYLRRLPVHEVKVDKSFVMNMVADDNDAVIVRSTIDLGHNLGLRVVAEGVQDEETWNRLSTLGCDMVQGYYLSRPLPATDLEKRFASEEASGSLRAPVRRGHLVSLPVQTIA